MPTPPCQTLIKFVRRSLLSIVLGFRKLKVMSPSGALVVMGNDIRDSPGTNEEHSSLKLSVYSTFISKLDKTKELK